ncbi:MAG: response regulator transcription factor [Actinomycetota bacterium]|nr:response regulator transcription factor [Actinomycetota bacterium]
MRGLKILIVDDHNLFRKGLRKILELEKDIGIIEEAANASEAVQKSKEICPDVVLMDITMPETDGIEATRLIKTVSPTSDIIILSMHDDDHYLFGAIKAGARGYVLKEATVEELVESIKATVKGESPLNPILARRILDEFANSQKAEIVQGDFDKLTQREKEILKFVAGGKKNEEIAKKLFISEKTVKNHLSNTSTNYIVMIELKPY